MVYGHFVTDAAGNKRFFVEGCNYCQISTGGQHGSNCPCKDTKVALKTVVEGKPNPRYFDDYWQCPECGQHNSYPFDRVYRCSNCFYAYKGLCIAICLHCGLVINKNEYIEHITDCQAGQEMSQ